MVTTVRLVADDGTEVSSLYEVPVESRDAKSTVRIFLDEGIATFTPEFHVVVEGVIGGV